MVTFTLGECLKRGDSRTKYLVHRIMSNIPLETAMRLMYTSFGVQEGDYIHESTLL